MIVSSFGGKTVFHIAKNFRGFYSKSCGAETKHIGNKLSTQKYVSHEHNCAKPIEKN